MENIVNTSSQNKMTIKIGHILDFRNNSKISWEPWDTRIVERAEYKYIPFEFDINISPDSNIDLFSVEKCPCPVCDDFKVLVKRTIYVFIKSKDLGNFKGQDLKKKIIRNIKFELIFDSI